MVGSASIRRVVAWPLLGLYSLVASGLPLPFGLPLPGGSRGDDRVAASRLAAKDRSRPFPCMDKPCGCATAEQCFANCCCHTPAERLAWARAHRVEPAVLASLQARVDRQTAAVEPSTAAQGGCCATKTAAAGPSCCGSAPADRDDAAEMCRDYESLAADSSGTREAGTAAAPAEHDRTDEPPARPRVRVIVLRALLACGGLAAEWFAIGDGGLPPPRVDFVPRPGRDEPLVAGDETPFRLAVPPAAPPPRAV